MANYAVSLIPFYSAGQTFTNSGVVNNGGKIYTYYPGTTTLMTTYPDYTGNSASPNANPIILNAYGRMNTEIWIPEGNSVKVVVEDQYGNILETKDNISSLPYIATGGVPAIQVDLTFYVNILNYGADPTGMADSTTAIQSAIVAASESNTFVYAPSGTYLISSPLNNSGASDFYGIIGNSSKTTIFNGASLTGHAFHFTNIPQGSVYSNFSVEGPGQSAAVTSTGLLLDLTGSNVIVNLNVSNVLIVSFPTEGLHVEVPIVSNFQNVECQLIGSNGFYCGTISESLTGSGGTSTTWVSCYANNCLGNGYYFINHAYYSMTGCAADYFEVAYNFYACSGGSINGCGCEDPTYTSSSHPGIGYYIYACSGMSYNACRMFTTSTTNSASLILYCDGSSFMCTFNGMEVTEVIGYLLTSDIVITSGCADLIFINPSCAQRSGSKAIITGATATTLVISGNSITGSANPQFQFTSTATNATNISFGVNDSAQALVLYDIVGGQALASFGNIAGNQTTAFNYKTTTAGTATFNGAVTSNAAVTIAGHTLTINGTANPSTVYTSTSSGTPSISVGVNGSSKSFVIYDQVASTALLTAYSVAGGGTVLCSGPIGVNGNAAPSQVTGFGTPVGNNILTNFPGTSATLVQTSEMVSEILLVLKALGFIGA
jgi:hypothetical protein